MGYRVAVVGATGNVGREMFNILEEVKFPVDKMHAIASRKSIGVEVSFGNEILKCEDLEQFDFSKVDLVLMSAGGIVLFGSLVGFQGVPRAANYAATKAFIQSFVEGLRPELKQFGVDVISVAPGPVASGFAARANMVMGAAAKPGRIPREALAALGRKTTVRPGFLSKALEALFFGLPRGARTLIMTQVMKSMARGTAEGMPSPPGR